MVVITEHLIRIFSSQKMNWKITIAAMKNILDSITFYKLVLLSYCELSHELLLII